VMHKPTSPDRERASCRLALAGRETGVTGEHMPAAVDIAATVDAAAAGTPNSHHAGEESCRVRARHV